MEQVYGYYIDFASNEEKGAEAEAHNNSVPNDLEVMLQEQLPMLAEDATEEQHIRKKRKAVIMEIEPTPLQQ